MSLEGLKVVGNQFASPDDGGTSRVSENRAKAAWTEFQAKYGKKPEKPREVKKTLDKDDFLKIMVTQMQHQDPTNPFETDKLAQEIAQISTVEQLSNVNTALKQLAESQAPIKRMQSTSLIGKVVTVDRSVFGHEAGKNSVLSYTLPSNAQELDVKIMSDSGEVVAQRRIGATDAGANNFIWDGKQDNTTPAKTGRYFFRLEARDADGRNVSVNTVMRKPVIGVSYQGDDAMLFVGDSQNQEKISLSEITKIEASDGSGPAVQAKLNVPSPSEKSNFFAFEKGVGSKPLDLGMAPKQVQEAIKKAEEEQKPVVKNLAEKGFPNGLGMYEEGAPAPGIIGKEVK